MPTTFSMPAETGTDTAGTYSSGVLTMPAAAAPGDPHLVGLAAIKRSLNATTADTTRDAELLALIGEASAQFEADTAQPIARRTAYLYTFRTAGREHFPPIRKINSISALQWWDNTNDAGSEWEAVTGVYRLRPEVVGGAIYYRDSFCIAYQYRATLSVGYATIPDDVQRAVKDRVILLWKDVPRGGDRAGRASEAKSMQGQGATDSYSWARHDGLWQKTVNRYKLQL